MAGTTATTATAQVRSGWIARLRNVRGSDDAGRPTHATSAARFRGVLRRTEPPRV
jgi:hypothetical protein